MKLLFDQNLSRKLPTRIADIFPHASHVQFHSLTEANDSKIWEFAQANNFCIVTQDVDFAERSRLYGSPPKVIWLRCGNATTNQVEIMIRTGAEAIKELMTNKTFDCLELY